MNDAGHDANEAPETPPVLSDGLELGYIRLWRKIKGSAILRDPHLLQLWIWILVKAAWGPRTVSIVTGRGRTLVHLQPGQFVFGRKSAGDELGQPAETLRGRMGRLKSYRMVTTQPATHYSVVTVVNWASYQGGAGKDTTQPTGQHTNQPPGNRHKEEVKALKKDQNTSPSAPAEEPPSGKGKGLKGQPKKKHAVYRMPPEAYEDFIRSGVTGILSNAEKLGTWSALYPGVKVEDEIHDAAGWLLDRTEDEKDRRPHLTAFFGNWLRRSYQTASRAGGKRQ